MQHSATRPRARRRTEPRQFRVIVRCALVCLFRLCLEGSSWRSHVPCAFTLFSNDPRASSTLRGHRQHGIADSESFSFAHLCVLCAFALRSSPIIASSSSPVMKLLTCPINGPRPVSEFVYGGEVRPMPDPEPPPTRNGPTTCSIAAACRASRRSGGTTRRAAPGSSPSATSRTTSCCRPTCSGRGHRSDVPPAAAARRVDRSRSAAALSVRGPGLRGFRGRHGDQRTVGGRCARARAQLQVPPPARRASLANHDANALMADGRSLNLRADVLPLEDGMRLQAVNTFGGLHRDRAGVLDKLSALLPVGFYYKAFYRPKWTVSLLGEADSQAERSGHGQPRCAARAHGKALRFRRCPGDRRWARRPFRGDHRRPTPARR